jgi:mRNA interferase RelE/StbE
VYEILVERAVERQMRNLPPEVFSRVLGGIKRLAEEPRPPGCRKLKGAVRVWRIRVGSYRVLYEINDAARQLRVLRVAHRREVYL